MTRVERLFISPGHNYYGHHGQPPDTHPILEVGQVECVAGRGLRGDRFFDHQQDFYQASPTDAPVTIPTNVEAELFDQASKQKKQFEELDNFLRTTEVFVEAARYYSKTILPR